MRIVSKTAELTDTDRDLDYPLRQALIFEEINPQDSLEDYMGGNIYVVEKDEDIYKAIPKFWHPNDKCSCVDYWKNYDCFDCISMSGDHIVTFAATNNSGGPSVFIPIDIAINCKIDMIKNIAEFVKMAANEIRIDENTLRITRYNIMTRQNVTKDLQITEEQWQNYRSGKTIQSTLGHLSDIQREFIMTGIDTEEQWNEAVGDESEYEYQENSEKTNQLD